MHTEILPGHISEYVYINYLLITKKTSNMPLRRRCVR